MILQADQTILTQRRLGAATTMEHFWQERLFAWLGQDKLQGYSRECFEHHFHSYCQEIAPLTQPLVLVALKEPHNFLAALMAVLCSSGSIVLGNAQWQQREWQELQKLIRPDYLWGQIPTFAQNWQGPRPNLAPGHILIPTGGTSGDLKLATHTWDTLRVAVTGFQTFWGPGAISCFCLLPLYHVGGLMQFLRSWLSGGDFWAYPYSGLKNKPPAGDFQNWFISLVPTQLQFLLEHHPHWLAQFKTILVGGGPIWPGLWQQAGDLKLNLAPTYGMTETAGQVAALKPADFLGGQEGVGQVLPHIDLRLLTNDKNLTVTNQKVGLIQLNGGSVFGGYYPQYSWEGRGYTLTEDLGFWDHQGNLHLVGRQGNCIISGGEKVNPREVEEVILATQLVEDVAVLGLHDRHWGERVVAVYVPRGSGDVITPLENYLRRTLAAYKCPKDWFPLPSLGRSPLGKLNYAGLRQTIETIEAGNNNTFK